MNRAWGKTSCGLSGTDSAQVLIPAAKFKRKRIRLDAFSLSTMDCGCIDFSLPAF